MSNASFTILYQGHRLGPYREEEIASMLALGAIDSTAQVWSDGWTCWHPVTRMIRASPQAPAPSTTVLNYSTADPIPSCRPPLLSGVEFTCPQCGTCAEVPKLSKGALRFCPNCGAANVNPAQVDAKSLALAEASSPADALEIYNEVLRSDPHNYDAWLGRGRSLIALSTLEEPAIEESMKSIENAIKFAPHDKKISLAPQASDELETLALNHYGQANVFMESFMRGEHSPVVVSQVWQIYVAASDRAVALLNVAINLYPLNRSAIQNVIAICRWVLGGRQAPVRRDIESPDWVVGPTWFVAAAIILPPLLRAGQVVLRPTPDEHHRFVEALNHFSGMLVAGGGSLPPPPPR